MSQELKPKLRLSQDDELCGRCGVISPTWFTDNDLWNLIDLPGILCPLCFIELAEKKGVETTAWKIVPEERIALSERERDLLRERCERLSAPVSDEEMQKFALHWMKLGTLRPVLTSTQADALIAARMEAKP